MALAAPLNIELDRIVEIDLDAWADGRPLADSGGDAGRRPMAGDLDAAHTWLRRRLAIPRLLPAALPRRDLRTDVDPLMATLLIGALRGLRGPEVVGFDLGTSRQDPESVDLVRSFLKLDAIGREPLTGRERLTFNNWS